jgi:hypothetical protein
MKNQIKKLFLFVTISLSFAACSSDDNSNAVTLNQYENRLVGRWESMTTPHPNGNNDPTTYYKSFFTFRSDKSGIVGYDEIVSPVDQFSESNNIKWEATNTTITVTYEDNTEGTRNYELIDSNNLRVINPDGESLVYTKQ